MEDSRMTNDSMMEDFPSMMKKNNNSRMRMNKISISNNNMSTS